MLNQKKGAGWRNRLPLLVVIGVLVISSASGVLIRDSDNTNPNNQAPISISSYLRDYALLSSPTFIDSKPHKVKVNVSYTNKASSPENASVAHFLPHSQSLLNRSLCMISICFAVTDTTYLSWLHHAGKLIDLPPPPPDKFMELV
jgi:hypothetical protein